MKFAIRTLAIVVAIGLFCPTSSAKVFRKTLRNPNQLSIDVNGNLANNSNPAISRRIIKGIKFSRSGIIINRVRYKDALNESGKRIILKNLPDLLVYDPDLDTISVIRTKRNRFTFPRGRRNLMLMVTARLILVSDPSDQP